MYTLFKHRIFFILLYIVLERANVATLYVRMDFWSFRQP